jgi:hypothetical protein
MIEAIMHECIARGASIIIATSWGYLNSCEKMTEKRRAEMNWYYRNVRGL